MTKQTLDAFSNVLVHHFFIYFFNQSYTLTTSAGWMPYDILGGKWSYWHDACTRFKFVQWENTLACAESRIRTRYITEDWYGTGWVQNPAELLKNTHCDRHVVHQCRIRHGNSRTGAH